MADIQQLVRTSELKLNALENLSKEESKIFASVKYIPGFDALLILFDNCQKRYITHPIDEYVSLLYEPGTKEVIGIQVEAFEKSFVHKYADLEKTWKLSDNCEDFPYEDMGDIYLMIESRRPRIAREVGKITEQLIYA